MPRDSSFWFSQLPGHFGTLGITHERPWLMVNWTSTASRRFFRVGCTIELGLGIVGVLLMLGLDRPFFSWWALETNVLIVATLSIIPLCAVLCLTLHSRSGPLHPIRRWLEETLRPLLKEWRMWQIGCLSLLAGIGEELFFRGAIQNWLQIWWGSAPALILTSILFGALHYVNLAYALVSSLMALFLGVLMLATHSLVAPILTHVSYDFFALVYLSRFHQPQSPSDCPTS